MIKRQELLTMSSGDFEIPYNWAVGIYGSKFLQELRDNRRLLGIKCPSCGLVYVPPRQVCGPCFVKMDEWVELETTGVLQAFSVVNYQFIDPATGISRPIPYTYGYVKPDGADTTFSHIINENDPAKLRPGIRVRAVFAEERRGTLLDIEYFEVID